MPSWKVLSYHTPDQLYRSRAAALKTSLEAFAIPYDCRELPSLGSWEANAARKADLILEALEAEPGAALVWLDADAVVRQYPALFDDFPGDFGAHWYVRPEGRREMQIGTIFLRSTPAVCAVVRLWRALIPTHQWHACPDQMALQTAIEGPAAKLGVKVVELPPAYSLMTGTMEEFRPAVIEQTQASRIARLI